MYELAGFSLRDDAATEILTIDPVGAFTYVYATDYPYNHARARRAVTFTDSLALAFTATSLEPLTY